MGVRAAILGCGGMARTHAAALSQAGIDLLAYADRRPEPRAAYAALAPAGTGYADALELLAAERPELVVVATNGPSHAPLTIAAAEAGARWILCEKPMACGLAEARQMVEACAAQGTRLAINHTRRWSPPHRALREALAGGVIGRPRCYLISVGAGRLGCIATHLIDLVRQLSGQDLADVSGWIDPTGTPDPRGPEFSDPGGHAVFHLTDGARVYLDQMEDLGLPPSLEIVGSVGRLRVDDLDARFDVRARRPEDRDRPLLAYGCPLVPVALDFDATPVPDRWTVAIAAAYRELLGDGPISCGGEDGYRAVEGVLAIHLSHQRGHQPVALPLTGDDLDFRIDFT